MPKFSIHVRRCYWHDGEIEIEARSPERAEQMALEQLDDIELEVSSDFIREFDVAHTLIT